MFSSLIINSGVIVEDINQKIEKFIQRKERLKQNYIDLHLNKKSFSDKFSMANHEVFNKKIENIVSFLTGSLLHYENIKILDYIEDSQKLILRYISSTDNGNAILYLIEETSDFIERYLKIQELFQSETINSLESAILDVNSELSNFRRLRSIADTGLTESIYDNAVKEQRKHENNYRLYFYWSIGILLSISIFMFAIKQYLVASILSNVEFWIIKLSIIAVGITLISYFLKQSSHYQRLADQNYQTQVELQAYPSFMESIPTEEAASVRKELALKYFGREIDGAAHKDMSNLIFDQIKSTTDMVKATTEAIKNLKVN